MKRPTAALIAATAAALIAATAAALIVAGAATVTAHTTDNGKQPTPPAVRKTITGWIIR